MRRVVVTGMGMVTPLGDGVETTWTRLLRGESGAGQITHFDTTDYATKYACEVPFGDGTEGTFNPDAYLPAKERRRLDTFILFGMAAAQQALSDAGWSPEDDESLERTGVLVGSGIGGIESIYHTSVALSAEGPKRMSPFFITGSLVNLLSGQISIRHGFKGPNMAIVSACATGAHAIGEAARMIQFGDADVMLAGGAEAAICGISIGGFNACRALSTKRPDDPTRASRPWDKDRDGFVMGEGAGVVVLESLDHAVARGAQIHAELLGYGLSGDAHHITAPAPAHEGAGRAMRAACRNAGIAPQEIDYVNAHGTSTMADILELEAVERLVGQEAAGRLVMSSTKSSTGHLLGAAGAIEAIFTILAVKNDVAPPTLNLDNVDAETAVNLCAHHKVERRIDIALSNSFAFGGANASLIFGKAPSTDRSDASHPKPG